MRNPIRAMRELSESIRQAGAFGGVPVPGSGEVTLPAGQVKVWYYEARNSGDAESISFFRPEDLRVTVTPSSGGAELPIEEISRNRNKSTGHGRSLAMLGSFQVTTPGAHSVAATATLAPDAVQPQVHFGP